MNTRRHWVLRLICAAVGFVGGGCLSVAAIVIVALAHKEHGSDLLSVGMIALMGGVIGASAMLRHIAGQARTSAIHSNMGLCETIVWNRDLARMPQRTTGVLATVERLGRRRVVVAYWLKDSRKFIWHSAATEHIVAWASLPQGPGIGD